MHESRLKKSLLNARVNLVFYFLTLILAFFSRKIFLDSLGADFLGLIGTLQNLLGLLNLAEMGIGAAIGYVLYRPLYESDRNKINEIISVLGYMYRCVGIFILIVGVVFSLFLHKIFPETIFETRIIYFAYYSFLTSSLIGYFINYKQTLLGADQRNYVVTAYFQTANIIKIVIQMLLAHYLGNYYLWVIIELLFGIIYSLILNWKIKKVYPWLESEVRLGASLLKKYPNVIKNTKQLFVHKIGAVVYNQVSPLIIYSFASLQTVAYYGNYTLIISKLDGLINNILGSTSAGVGSLIAEGNKSKILDIYWELMVIRFWIASVFIFAIYHLLPPFIVLWIGEEYLLSNTILLLVLITYFLNIVRGTNEQFLLGYGLFNDIWSPFAEATIMIVVSIIGGKMLGFEGVLWGSISSTTIIIYVWKPYFLFKKGFKLSVWKYWIPWLKNLILLLSSFVISKYLLDFLFKDLSFVDSWKDWVVYAFVIVIISSLISFSLYYVGTKGMRLFVKRLINRSF